MILGGDINAETGTNPAGAQQLDRLVTNFGMQMLAHEPTFYRGGTATKLDNILLYSRSVNEPVTECEVLICDYTAHHCKLVGKVGVPRCR